MLLCASRLLHIGVGRVTPGARVIMLVADLDVRILNSDTGDTLRQLIIDPSRNYPRIGPG